MSYITSSTLTDRCGNSVTTDCCQYVGPAISCLNICTGDVLTSTQISIANAICELYGDVDVTSIILPQCFINAWSTTDKNILNFLNFLLQQACYQQNQVDQIIDGEITLHNLDPIITIDYPQCCQSACSPGATLKISTHLENILTCLCNLYTLVGSVPSQYASLSAWITQLQATVNGNLALVPSLQNRITNLESTVTSQQAQIVTLTNKINCIITNISGMNALCPTL